MELNKLSWKPTLLTNVQLKRVLKAAVWSGASAMVTYLITFLTGHPDALGELTWALPVVNTVLVTLKQFFTLPE